MSNPVSEAENLPGGVPTPVVSVSRVTLPAPDRGDDLQVRVSAPATGEGLPIIIFSHGFGLSADAYAPLVDFWAAHGFVVLQPTHLDSLTLALPPEDPRTPRIWRYRVEDLRHILDHLDQLEAAVPGLAGRTDHGRVAAAGHSWGGTTASALLGARVLDDDGGQGEGMSDQRITAGVLLSTPGVGGAELLPFAAAAFPFMKAPSFTDMTTPTLMVAGDHDQSPLSTRGPDWFSEPYRLSPGPKSLLTLFGAEHALGGIHGYNQADTTDESPDRVALIRRLTWAYLRHALGVEDASWTAQLAALADGADPLGRLESK